MATFGDELYGQDLLQQLTNLLFENDCTVNRPAMVKLTEFVVGREQSIFDQYIRESEKYKGRIANELLKYSEPGAEA